MEPFLQALALQAGYNASLVAIGAALLGFAAGACGTFLFLRKRALVSDAVAHATLPGIGIAFIIMVAIGLDGRSLIGLMLGSAISAGVGLWLIEWMVRQTRLSEDAAIGAILSVFFGFGVVVLTAIQSMNAGRQAGLEGFLLGSTAGMLFEDALIIASAGGLAVLVTLWLRKSMTLVAFDAEYAAASGYNVRRIDLIMMGLVMAVTVIGLKLVGLVLIVAMLIIPPVTARFWSEHSGHIVWISGILGALSAYTGAALSASAPALPTGPMIVLTASALFLVSLFLAPARGVASAIWRRRRFQQRVHRRQGLLALAHGEPIFEAYTIRLLMREKLARADGVATEAGRALAAKIARDEKRWEIARQIHQDAALIGRYDGLTPIEDIFTSDEIKLFDQHIGGPQAVPGAG